MIPVLSAWAPRRLLGLLLVAGALGAAGYGLYAAGLRHGRQAAPSPATAPATQPLPQTIAQGEEATRRHMAAGLHAGDMDPATGRRILYYHDPMVPGNRFEQPGKSPFMDMMLVPVYADSGSEADGSQVRVSPRMQQNLGVRLAEVTQGPLSAQVAAVGSIAFNERDQVVVAARAAGYVERLHVRATLDAVAPGQALAELFMPDWLSVQLEFLAVQRMQGSEGTALVDAARQRMRVAGMSDAQIALVERSGQAQPRFTLAAPIGGVVTELMVREGMAVPAGAMLLRLQGMASVWALAEVPESQSALLRPGVNVQATAAAVPGARFQGPVQALLPEVDPATRTRRVRVELANPGGALVPGMSVQVRFTGLQPRQALQVPSEAVIQTGQRTLVMVAEPGGGFRAVEVEAGLEADGRTEIRRGLQAGQRVVASGQFLIDSEASLKGLEARLLEAPPAPGSRP
jgi:Cu(I)/Ag(I) efflux system membrane fusion protein